MYFPNTHNKQSTDTYESYAGDIPMFFHRRNIMVQRNLFECCHGCGREVYLNETHYKAKLVDGKVYFHKGCYLYYVQQRGDILTNVLKYEPKK